MASTLLSLKIPEDIVKSSGRYSALVSLDIAVKAARYTIYALCEMYSVEYGENISMCSVLNGLQTTQAVNMPYVQKMLDSVSKVGLATDVCADTILGVDIKCVDENIRMWTKAIIRNLCSTVLEEINAYEVALIEAVAYE